jgi:hypothetical protein
MARTKDPKLELIAAVPLFAGFNRREIEALGRLMDEIDVKEGRVLMVLDIGGFRTLISKYPTVQGKIMRALAERLREAQPRAAL